MPIYSKHCSVLAQYCKNYLILNSNNEIFETKLLNLKSYSQYALKNAYLAICENQFNSSK